MTQKPIYEIHSEHKEWLNKLAFYADDLKIMQNRISEVASKTSNKEMLSFVDHFQNQVIIQKEQIDILKHNINKHEALLEKNINNNPVAVDHRKVDDHPNHKEEIATFEKMFSEFRKELLSFLVKWM